MFQKIMGRLTPLRLAIICGVLAILAIAAYRITFSPSEVIFDSGTSLAASHVIIEGDILTVRVSAREVSDMYGYQFRFEYDDTMFTVDGIQSLVADIPTIFKKNFDGYVLVGATMTGDVPGYSSSCAQLCELKLKALTTGDLSDIKLSNVNVVSSQLEYAEDVPDWTYEVTASNNDNNKIPAIIMIAGILLVFWRVRTK